MAPKTASSSSEQSNKRKSAAQLPSRPQKRSKASHDPREIRSQKTEQAFKNGELDVAKFVQAREFEIRALEDSMQRARGMQNSRAFQQVPRDMRRRTASHNVKKVPKRLRRRAKKEVSCHGPDSTLRLTHSRWSKTIHLL